jgi:hypothetical protein
MIHYARAAAMRLVRDRKSVGGTCAYVGLYDGRAGNQDVLVIEPLATTHDVQYSRFQIPDPAAVP